jgi:drug/metabolite transporter (DMT)-like permease
LPPNRATTALLVTASLACFAANSLLCRQALASAAIDPIAFTAVRIVSGAAALVAIARARRASVGVSGGWPAAAALFLYAAPFSVAYVGIGAGIGALVLFGSVQLTMFGWSVARGERLPPLVWTGALFALAGLAALTLPGASAPPLGGVALMVIAGLAWGAYTLYGRAQTGDPIATTAGAFVRAAPLALLLAGGAACRGALHVSAQGALLALASGVIASGVGYSIWYRTLPRIAASTAAVVQLLVPVVAAAGGTALLGERPSARLLGAGAAILGGVVAAVVGRSARR